MFKKLGKTIYKIYEKKYKILLIIPLILLLFAIVQISTQVASTGDIMNRDVSLSGGTTMNVNIVGIDSIAIEEFFVEKYPQYSWDVVRVTKSGFDNGILIKLDEDDSLKIDPIKADLINYIKEKGIEQDEEIINLKISSESMGAALSQSFFITTFYALIIAFLLMALVVFMRFRTFVPSMAVILAAFSDIIVTLAIVNLMGIKLSIAGIAAFLMLIGYSVDTDILLSTRVLKRREGTVLERVFTAMSPGITMTITTLAAILVMLFFSAAPEIQQIATIIFIGLLVDLVNTWIQNVGILRWYLERKKAD
ncbi:protein translocase subunit SecF [Nanoarchaeota archaeon]